MVLANRPGRLPSPRWRPACAAPLPIDRIEARLRTINYNSSDDGSAMKAAGEPLCGLWRESRQKSRGVLYGKTLIH
jgi:hypothetical protein